MYLVHEMRVNCSFKTELIVIICSFNLMFIPWKRWQRQKGWRHANVLWAVWKSFLFTLSQAEDTRWWDFSFYCFFVFFFVSIPARNSKSTAFTEQSPQIFIKQRGTISTHLLITSMKIIKYCYYYYYCYCCCCYCYAILYFQGPSSRGSHETSDKGARWAVRSLPRNCSWIN